jgi:hypothetical protein
VIDHQRKLGAVIGDCGCVRQVFDEKEEIERDLVLFEDLQAAENVRSHDEVDVWLVMRDVADATGLGVLAEFEELAFAVSAREIDPADDAGDEVVLVGQAQDPAVFGEVVLGLDEDGPVDSGCPDFREEIRPGIFPV